MIIQKVLPLDRIRLIGHPHFIFLVKVQIFNV